MAKKRGYPKQPKASSSIDVWKRYEDKVKEIDKYNAQLEKDKKAKKDTIARVKKLKAKR